MYLAGPGRANEHTNPHIVSGSDHVTMMVDSGAELSRDDALDVARTLDQPRKAYGTNVTSPVKRWNEEAQKREMVGRKESHVWHCSLSLRAEEGTLTDQAWETLAEEFVGRMGFIDPDGAKSSRWVAIHHGASKNGNDHVHIVVQMVTEDGSKARTHNDFARAQKVCGQLENEYGLEVTEGRENGQALSAEKPGETKRAEREHAPWVEKKELRRRVRAALSAAGSEANFVSRVYQAGVIIRPRFATGRTNEVTGYSVALPAPAGSDRDPLFYAPSKLDKSLSLPNIRKTLGTYANGDPQALGTWQEHHRSTRTTEQPRTAPMNKDLRARAVAGDVSHADLARIFAAGSMKYERNEPGPMAELSEHHAQLALNPPAYGYMARQLDRALSKDAAESWSALLMQAARLSRVMAETQFAGTRPRLGAANMALAASVISEAQKELDRQAERAAARQAERPHDQAPKTATESSVEDTELPGYMSPAEFADLKSALQKRPRLDPTVSNPTPEETRPPERESQSQSAEKSEGATR